MSDRYARLIELPDRPVADWDRIPADGELFRDGTDVYMGDGVTAAASLTPINGGGPGGPASWGSITGTLSSQTDLQTALNGKANTSHTHIIANVTGLQAALDGKQAAGSYANASHTHAISDVTGLQAALDEKTNHAAVMRRTALY